MTSQSDRAAPRVVVGVYEHAIARRFAEWHGMKTMKATKTLRLMLGGLVVASVLGLWSDAEAQERGRRGRKVIRIAETRVEGRIQKPQAFYILQRSSLNFEGLELKNSFVPKIIKSVDKAPF